MSVYVNKLDSFETFIPYEYSRYLKSMTLVNCLQVIKIFFIIVLTSVFLTKMPPGIRIPQRILARYVRQLY